MYWRQPLVILGSLALAVVLVGVFGFRPLSFIFPSPMASKTISVGTTTLQIEIVDTEAAREQGLSGRDSLKEGSGMLFVFQTDNDAGIWMKGMKFSLDIIWLDASGTVVTIAPNTSPTTYPKAFYPARPARYVLEVPAGFAASHSVAVGDTFVLQ